MDGANKKSEGGRDEVCQAFLFNLHILTPHYFTEIPPARSLTYLGWTNELFATRTKIC